MHYFKHSWDELFQDFRFFGDDFICRLLHQRQDTLYPIAKARRYLVILILFLQELSRGALLLPPISQWRAQTSNVTLVTLKTAFAIGFNYHVSVYARSIWRSDNLPLRRQHHIATPYPRTSLPIHSSMECIPVAILRVHGAMSVELPPTRTLISRRQRWAVGAKIRTVLFAENRTSRDPLCFPITTGSVLLNQICADSLVIMTDAAR